MPLYMQLTPQALPDFCRQTSILLFLLTHSELTPTTYPDYRQQTVAHPLITCQQNFLQQQTVGRQRTENIFFIYISSEPVYLQYLCIIIPPTQIHITLNSQQGFLTIVNSLSYISTILYGFLKQEAVIAPHYCNDVKKVKIL